ncbi:MAG: LacI family DNA-binding transcriptional regulator [Anaerolineae bacterium]
MSKTTIRDVAKFAGVGVGTVSRVLNNSPAVSESTRLKVQAAIKALNFSPNLAARRLSQGKSMAIGVIVPFFTNPSVVRRLQGVVSVLSVSEYDLILFDIEKIDQRDMSLRTIPQRKLADGLLLISLTPSDMDVEQFALANIPTVLVDAYHPALSRVRVDNVEGGYLATRHLIDLGHRQIGYISDYLDDPFNSPVRDRFTGYKRALAEAGIEFCSEYHLQGEHGRTQARQMAHDLLTLPDPPSAIFAYSDTQAIGVIEAAKALGIRIPEHLSVVGFDNIEAAEYLHITTVRQALFESGVKGAKLLLEIMATPSSPPQELVLPTELVIRNTTAPYAGTTATAVT